MARHFRILPLVLAASLATAGVSGAHTLFNPPDVAAENPGDTMAVIYSGDGGWGPLDEGVAKHLAAQGVPVVGVNSLTYFMDKRTPQQVADDLARSLRAHEARWGTSKVVLVGYSFGADALPAIVPLLPEDLRPHVKSLVLVGVGPSGDLRFHTNSWLNKPSHDSFPTAPAIEALAGLPMTCIYGDKEHHDICANLPDATIRKVELSGGHHFHGDYTALGQAIYEASRL